jgi:C1A family cysteine protease
MTLKINNNQFSYVLKYMNIVNLTTLSPVDDRDWVLESIVDYHQTLPSTLDYRPLLQDIRNQGDLPTCAAQTAACIKEYQEHKDIQYNDYLSPMFIYDNRSNQDTEGMFGRDVMSILAKKGICQESLLPYEVGIMKPDVVPAECYTDAINFKIKGYALVNTILGVKTALVLYGPCYIAFPIYSTNNTDIWKPSSKGEPSIGGHAMTVVGYTNDSFIIRNSWGSSWGQNGYCYYPFNDFGCHWEIWTSVDDKSTVVPNRPKTKRLLCC